MTQEAASIAVTVNGEETRIPAGLSLLGLVERLGRDPRTVAIEHNGEIVRRAAYGDHVLGPGDRLEIVHFVQGG
jgi:thiamine biosynthesis protein ThiS